MSDQDHGSSSRLLRGAALAIALGVVAYLVYRAQADAAPQEVPADGQPASGAPAEGGPASGDNAGFDGLLYGSKSGRVPAGLPPQPLLPSSKVLVLPEQPQPTGQSKPAAKPKPRQEGGGE